MLPLVDLKTQYRTIQPEIDAAIAAVLADAQFIKGPHLARFERNFAAFAGCEHVVGASSGTTAIHLALAALGIGRGDEVILPSMTFFASVEPVIQCGAAPVFADIDARTCLIDPESVARCIGPRTRAILPVHLYGQMADMDALIALARAADPPIALIEDCAQAHGARQGERRAGASGDAGCFSFFPGKNLGAFGDAGAVVTGDAALAARLASLADHGRSAKYLHDTPGFNYRMDALQAAILDVKLAHLERWNAQRVALAELYDALLAEIAGIETPAVAGGNRHVFHLYVIQLDERDELLGSLRANGIEAGVHYPVPIHEQPALRGVACRTDSLERTERAARRVLSLPIFPEMTPEQVFGVASAIRGWRGSQPVFRRVAAATAPV